ncbi:MAG TPA: hypothetical protein VFQ60_00365 [Patescibacteria group bacterium]|nr:hypothetical protein [Patescibacteria group bacterium]
MAHSQLDSVSIRRSASRVLIQIGGTEDVNRLDGMSVRLFVRGHRLRKTVSGSIRRIMKPESDSVFEFVPIPEHDRAHLLAGSDSETLTRVHSVQFCWRRGASKRILNSHYNGPGEKPRPSRDG